jgi:histidinol-phosphate aminotransferase
VTNPFPPARQEVENLQAYSAPLEGRRGLLRLDFNENTIGPSPKVVEALRSIPADAIAIYPEYDGLREAVVANLSAPRADGSPSLAHPLSPDQIGLFNGVDAAIHAIFHSYGECGDTLLTTSPTFGYYAPCARMQGMVIEAIAYEGPDFAFPLAAMRRTLLDEPWPSWRTSTGWCSPAPTVWRRWIGPKLICAAGWRRRAARRMRRSSTTWPPPWVWRR